MHLHDDKQKSKNAGEHTIFFPFHVFYNAAPTKRLLYTDMRGTFDVIFKTGNHVLSLFAK